MEATARSGGRVGESREGRAGRRRSLRRALLARTTLSLLLPALLAATPAAATDWEPGITGLWSDGVNWDTGSEPTAADTVRFPAGGKAFVDGAAESGNLEVDDGRIDIRNGGSLNSGAATLGEFSMGEVYVHSGGSWTGNGGIRVGDFGEGRLSVLGGSVTVVGGGLIVGIGADGTLAVRQGGTVDSAQDIVVGRFSGPVGTAIVSGAGSLLATDAALIVGDDGDGVMTLHGGGTARAGAVAIAEGLFGTGGLVNIGAAEGAAPAAPGMLDSPTVTFGPGDGRIVFNHDSESYVFAPDVSGNGELAFLSGTTDLTGDYAGFTGSLELSGGTLSVGTVLPGSVTVGSGATLGGTGTVGSTIVASGATLAPGNSIGMLTVAGNLTLTPGSLLEFELGAPGSEDDPASGLSDRVVVTGNLTLDGTLNLAQSDDAADGTAGFGYYRLMTYGGTLTDDGLLFGTLPAGFTAGDFEIQAGGGSVDLFLSAGGAGNLQHWQGGDGVWTTVNWLDVGGDGTLVPWAGNHALFMDGEGWQGGTVTVTGSPGFKGLQFVDAGYRLTGDGQLVIDGSDAADGNAEIRVLADSAEIATAIAGTGGITKTEGGRLILSGDNSYAGGTVLAAGTVEVASDANLGAAAGGLAFTGGTLATTASFDSARPMTVTGTGGFEVAGGTQLGLGGALGGAGTLTKAGAGTLQFDGDGSGFTGTTRVADGLLSVGGRLGGTVAVLSGGTLGGVGTVGATTVSSGAALAPGNSIGTLSVAGDLDVAAGSAYLVEVDPTGPESDRTEVTGVATLGGGTVVPLLVGAYRPDRTYEILTAGGGVAGVFAGAASIYPFLTAELFYDPGSVHLTLGRNAVPFTALAETPNQAAAASGADSLGEGDAVHDAVVGLSDAAAIRGAFDALSGEIHASTRTVLLDDSRFLRAAVGERLRAAGGAAMPAGSQTVLAYGESGAEAVPADSGRFAAWGQAYGSWGSWDGDGGSGSAELDRSTGGVFLGADAPVLGEEDPTRLGLLLGYGRSWLSVDGRASEATVDSYSLGGYAGTEVSGVALRLGAAHSWHEIDSERSLSFGGFSERAEAGYDARTLQVFGEVGYAMSHGRTSLEPFAGLAWVRLDSDGFEEDGAAGLEGEGEASDLGFSTLGLRAETAVTLGGLDLKLHAAPAWRHAIGDVESSSTLAFPGGDPFTVGGVPLARDTAVLAAGLSLELPGAARLGLSYSGQAGGGTQDHGLDASLRIRF